VSIRIKSGPVAHVSVFCLCVCEREREREREEETEIEREIVDIVADLCTDTSVYST
jgi:hypothetical protein